jgi:hypothetical protein
VRVFQKGKMTTLTPAYSGPYSNIYLIDLRTELPDSVTSCGGRWISNWVGRIPSNTEYTYFSENVEIDFPANALYDTLALSLRVRADSATHRESISIGNETVPLFQSIRVIYQPQTSNVNPARNMGVYRKEGGGYAYLGNNWKNGRYFFQTLSFGEFTFLQDSIAPLIKPIAINSAVARLRIKDDLSGIAYFEANVNGQWLLMNYDYKTGILFSERLDSTKPLQGEFELKVVDQAGNESIHKHKIP